MTLRTRRRISPRTKRRYRAIRNFFRRTLGSIASQPDIKINSSIAVNVTDLNHKIVGIEHQLDEFSKNCHDLASFENISRKEIESLIPTEGNGMSVSKIHKGLSDKKLTEKDTKLLYKTSESHFRKADNSGIINNLYNEPRGRDRHSPGTMNYEEYGASVAPVQKTKSKKSRRDVYYDSVNVSNTNLRKHRTRPEYETAALYADSYPCLTAPKGGPHAVPARPGQRHGRRQTWQEEQTTCPIQEEAKVKTHKDRVKRNKSESPTRRQEKRHGNSKKNNIRPVGDELDQDFIADIIQRQYKPVKYFGHRSDTSQISFPVCRDHEFCIRQDVTNGSEMCSCCLTGRAPARRRRSPGPALSDMRSLCDARLYSARHRARSRPRKQHAEVYNDSDLYDVVPVKEKSSPKSRRKFVEDNMHYEYLEVPPSPRSHRPRLNLQAQNYHGCESSPMTRAKQSRRRRSPYQQRRPECVDYFRSEISSEESTPIRTEIKSKSTKNAEIQEDMGTVSSLQYPEAGITDKINATFNDTLNKTDSNSDKTDKALSEIKDILQNFLQEIKKESSAFQCDKSSEAIGKTNEKCFEDFQQESARITPTVLQNSGQNEFPGYGLGPCSPPVAAPPFLANPCCYRVMPVCPMNCVQNGYLVASSSYNCQGCVNSHNESDIRQGAYIPKESNTCENSKINTETDNLIREIYKYVAQNPNNRKKESAENAMRCGDEVNTKRLTSRSVGKSSYTSRHDAGVCTLPLRCYSKSCEAIGSRAPADARSRTNASYSDTVLEKMNSDATTQSSSSYETSDSSALNKDKKSKFASVLQSFGLLKKNKKNRKDTIEEVSESESSTEMDAKPNQRHPFRQDITNYMMHAQDFYHPPPAPPPHRARHQSPHYDYGYSTYDRMNEPVNGMYDPYRERIHANASAPPFSRMRPQASAPPYPCPCEPCRHNMQPQVPLCLKEIEVQSTGTQSERKMSFFRKLSQRKSAPGSSSQPSRDAHLKSYGTQTAQSKPGLWKELQAKAASKKKFGDFEPFAFTMKDQKKLAEGDNKMRTAMLKKLFYKRNPFSPRNLIVRTLMGNDRSSWGIPPTSMVKRPRMFI